MGNEKAISIKELVKVLRTESLYKDKATLEIMDYCMMAAETIETVEARFEQLAARENPQPLTLDELRQMDGRPVWVETMGDWRIVCFGVENDIRLYSIRNTISARHVIDNDGRIYRYPPKEAPHAD